MMTDLPPELLNAIAFATRAHQGQFRKDGRTPYVSHVFRVCMTTRQLFGITDPQVLMAAVLHDTIEDTTTDFDDLAEHFGSTVAGWVAALSKDTRVPDEEREARYCQTLRESDWQVKVCKLADIHDNLTDSATQPPEKQRRTLLRSKVYLETIGQALPNEARLAFDIVTSLWRTLDAASR